MKIHHLGYLVSDIEKARSCFCDLGFEECVRPLGGVVRDEARQVDISFLNKDGYVIELISPIDRESPFFPLLKKYKNCSYHFCYESDDPEGDVEALLKKGWIQIDPFENAPAINGRKVGFFLHPSVGIIEIVLP